MKPIKNKWEKEFEKKFVNKTYSDWKNSGYILSTDTENYIKYPSARGVDFQKATEENLKSFISHLLSNQKQEIIGICKKLDKEFHYTKGKVRCYKCDYSLAIFDLIEKIKNL